jgi:dCTP deaminase
MYHERTIRRGELATLIGGERLRRAVADQTFIKGGDAASVENIKYDFRMSDRVLKAAFGQPMSLAEIPQEKRFVDPGEAVFVLTQERLDLPEDMIATLTPKRKLAHGGILVLGGFAIDPLYKGVILLGLYNFSSTPFPLRAGKKVVAALFYEISLEERQGDSIAPQMIDDFPDELVSLIRNYRPIELNGLEDSVENLKRELNNLRIDLTTDKTWKDEFKSSLEQHNSQLGKLIDSLQEERDARIRDDERISTKVESMSSMFIGLRWGWIAIGAAVTAGLGGLMGYLIPKLFS